MIAAIVLFGIAALGGLVLAALRLQEKPLPLPLALVHGAVAAAGLITLIVVVATSHASTLTSVALVCFIVAALGGFVLFSFHLRKRLLPIPVMLIHALVAVGAFVLLLVTIAGVA